MFMWTLYSTEYTYTYIAHHFLFVEQSTGSHAHMKMMNSNVCSSHAKRIRNVKMGFIFLFRLLFAGKERMTKFVYLWFSFLRIYILLFSCYWNSLCNWLRSIMSKATQNSAWAFGRNRIFFPFNSNAKFQSSMSFIDVSVWTFQRWWFGIRNRLLECAIFLSPKQNGSGGQDCWIYVFHSSVAARKILMKTTKTISEKWRSAIFFCTLYWECSILMIYSYAWRTLRYLIIFLHLVHVSRIRCSAGIQFYLPRLLHTDSGMIYTHHPWPCLCIRSMARLDGLSSLLSPIPWYDMNTWAGEIGFTSNVVWPVPAHVCLRQQHHAITQTQIKTNKSNNQISEIRDLYLHSTVDDERGCTIRNGVAGAADRRANIYRR